MMDGELAKSWSQRLRNARRRDRSKQTQALLSAFARLDDAVFREQIVILLEIIGSNPNLLAKLKHLQLVHSESTENVVQFAPVGNGCV
jgi:hypothetical protein